MQILVHVGCAKGGSSAIQQFLRANAAVLLEAGYVVPSSDLSLDAEVSGNQIAYFQQLSQQSTEEAIDSVRRRVRGIAAANPDAKAVLISAENLCNPVGFEDVFVELVEEFDVRVLMYVRRQDDYISSAWQQWYVKNGGSLTAWLSENVGVVADWHAYMQPWHAKLGGDRLEVRRYGREFFLNGSIFDDYCDFVDSSIDMETLNLPGQLVNRSLNADVSRWVEGRGHFFESPHDNEYYGFLYRMGGPTLVDKTAARPLFTSEEEIAIMKRYLRSNEMVRQLFMPNAEKPLFTLHNPKGQVAPTDARDETTRRMDAIESQLYNLYNELVKREII